MTAIKALHVSPQERFTAAIASSLARLTNIGYSHGRACSLLLKIIQWNQSPPPDSQVFDLMKKKGLPRDAVVKVLVVSRRLKDLSRHLSEDEAVNYLITSVRSKVDEHVGLHKMETLPPADLFQMSVQTSMDEIAESVKATTQSESSPLISSKKEPMNLSKKIQVSSRSINAHSTNSHSTKIFSNLVSNKKTKSQIHKPLRKRQHQDSTTSSPEAIVEAALEKKIAVVDTIVKKGILQDDQNPSPVNKVRCLSPPNSSVGRKRQHTHALAQTSDPAVNPASVSSKRARGL